MNAAIVVGIVADVLQLCLGPLGWVGADQIIDVVAMLILIRLVGFHWLFLPTFATELIPGIDMIPTWTGCVLWVIRQRKKEQEQLHKTEAPIVEVK